MAICAKEMHKPVYVVAESFKFTRIFPLNQDDVPREFKVTTEQFSSDFCSHFQQQSVTGRLPWCQFMGEWGGGSMGDLAPAATLSSPFLPYPPWVGCHIPIACSYL